MSYQLLESPWFAAISVIASIAAVAGSISTPFGLAPFWTDIAVLFVLIGASIHWLLYIRSSARHASAVGSRLARRRRSLTDGMFVFVRRSLYVPILLGLFIVWTAIPVVSQLTFARHWELCATFVSPCKSGPCLRFLDARKRPLGDCREYTDESGYFREKSAGIGAYRPAYVTGCAATDSAPIKLADQVFVSTCDSVVRIR